MIIPRDSDDADYRYTYNPWGNWGRWVLLAVVIIIIIAIIASFFVRSRQHNAPPQQEIPLAPVYPPDPTNGNQNPPPMYQPNGATYTGPIWHESHQQAYGEKNYAPPPGPPPPQFSGSGYMYSPPAGPPPPAAASSSANNYYGPPEGAPPSRSDRSRG